MSHHNSTFLFGSQAAPPPVALLVPALVAVALDVLLIFYCLDDLNRHEMVAGGDKRFWAVAIILGGPLGQIFYWMYGRGPD